MRSDDEQTAVGPQRGKVPRMEGDVRTFFHTVEQVIGLHSMARRVLCVLNGFFGINGTERRHFEGTHTDRFSELSYWVH